MNKITRTYFLTKKTMLFSLLIALSSIACKKEKGTTIYEDKPVIESYLYNKGFITVKISRQIPYTNEITLSNDDINNLDLILTCNNVDFSMTPKGNGLYTTLDSSLVVSEGGVYQLKFTFNESPVSTTTYVPYKPIGYTQSVTSLEIEQPDMSTIGSGGLPDFPDPVKLKWINNDQSYYLVTIENIDSNPALINDNTSAPDRLFRSEPTQENEYEIQSMQFQYYGKHRLILYHILPDYASLYSDNGSTSQNLTNPSSSIDNGLGIFTGINSDTLYLNVVKP